MALPRVKIQTLQTYENNLGVIYLNIEPTSLKQTAFYVVITLHVLLSMTVYPASKLTKVGSLKTIEVVKYQVI